MKAEIYWVDGPARVAILPRPRSGDWLEDEIASLRADGVDVLVSLLEAHEIEELDLAREPDLCRAAGIEFLSHPIPDHDVPPSFDEAREFVRGLERRLSASKSVAVHCRAGIGRSATVAAALLVEHGTELAEALRLLAEARGFFVPETPEQVEWLERFARGDPKGPRPPSSGE